MNEIKVSKKILRRIISVFLSLILLLLVVWLGFSFFSMQKSDSYLKTGIKVQESELKNKVQSYTYERDGKLIKYKYEIIPIAISYERDQYIIEGYDNNYLESYADIEDAKFKYALNKSEGKFDFTQLDWDEPVLLTFYYRVNNDFRYFTEFSICTLKRVFSDIFNITNEYSKGNCMVNREAYKWEIERLDIKKD